MSIVNIESMFPIPLYKSKLESLTTSHIDFLKNVKFETPNDDKILSFGVPSISSYILEEEILSDVKNEIHQHLNFYMEKILCPTPDHNLSFKITNSWVNRLDVGASIVPHLHRNSIVSGVFYLNSGNSSALSFMKPNYNRNIEYMYDFKQQNVFNEEHHMVIPEQFSLLLFPSDIEHFVHTNKTNSPRYSVAFNTFYIGNVGHKEDQNYLEFK